MSSIEDTQVPAPQAAPVRPARNPSRKSTVVCDDHSVALPSNPIPDAAVPAEPAPAPATVEDLIAPSQDAAPSSRPSSPDSTIAATADSGTLPQDVAPSSRPASIHSTASSLRPSSRPSSRSSSTHSNASRRKVPPPTDGLEDVIAAEASREAAYQAARRAAADTPLAPEARVMCTGPQASPPLRHKPSSMNLAAGYRQ